MGMYLMAATGAEMLATVATILKVALGLGFVIFVHELGHFLAAKACGVKCEKFYIGFDVPIQIGPIRLPRTLGKFRWGETEYGIGILPLGGYVKMLGQDDDPRKTLEENERIKQAGEEGQAYQLDPRSYPAKTVPQRLVIISAGVVMNLIFAVIFAGTAYRAGVNYIPCEVSWAMPGSPAWTAGFSPGDRIVQIGRNSHRNEHLRHDWDLRQAIGTHGDSEDLEFLVRRVSGDETWLAVRPFAATLEGKKQLPTIGVRPAFTTELTAFRDPKLLELTASGAKPEEAPAADPSQPQPGDKVVEVAGEAVETFEQLSAALRKQPAGPLDIVVLRSAGEGQDGAPPPTKRVEIRLAEVKRRSFGIATEFGPIAAVRVGSPAESAGLKTGDTIVRVAGEAPGNFATLDDRLRGRVGEEIEIEARSDGESAPKVVKLTVAAPVSLFEGASLGGLVGVESLGIAVRSERTIAAVTPGSDAAKAGLKAGDKLTAARYKSTADSSRKLPFDGKDFPIDDLGTNWPYIESQADAMDSSIRLVLTVDRGGKPFTAEIQPLDGDGYQPLRGLEPKLVEETRVAESWSVAFKLGARQTLEDVQRVATMLLKLVTGKVPLTNLGGPGSIATIAGIEASKGWTSLLMFLTLLSANLAVLNFMPVPALDGGHIMFLLYEWGAGKPVNERVQMVLTMIGVICLLSLMIVVSGLDVWRLFEWLS